VADFEIFDPSLRHYIPGSSRLERLYTGCRWTEGPVYFADGDFLLWSDIPANRMLRWAEGLGGGVFRCPSNYANGNTRDRQGRLVSCEHGGRRVTRTEPDGSLTVLAERYRGKRLNSPNDVVVASDGAVWFSDPPYGILTDYEGNKGQSELGANYLFRLDPASGELEIAADDFDRPNGLAFSPEEKLLYVTDTGRSESAGGPPHIRVFELSEGRRLRRGRVFADMRDRPADGLRLDTDGNVWTSAGAGVECYSPAGELILRIQVPERVSNLVFGGPKRNRLFITATSSLYALYVGCNGAQRP
jgi:gluconolactonase